jgi:hypothetical protein
MVNQVTLRWGAGGGVLKENTHQIYSCHSWFIQILNSLKYLISKMKIKKILSSTR